MKTKYMLIHHDEKLMVEKTIEDINLDVFDCIIFTIVKEFDNKY